jgi:hypothetical protein
MNTHNLEQAIEHVDRALEMIDDIDHLRIWQALEHVRQMLWDAVDHDEGLQQLFDWSDRQRELKL